MNAPAHLGMETEQNLEPRVQASLNPPRNQAVRTAVRDFTVTFFVDSVRPATLPPFPYAVTGSAAGRIQMHAYVPAHAAVDARYHLEDYFPDAYVECIEPGRVEPPMPKLHGVETPVRRLGLFRRLFAAFA